MIIFIINGQIIRVFLIGEDVDRLPSIRFYGYHFKALVFKIMLCLGTSTVIEATNNLPVLFKIIVLLSFLVCREKRAFQLCLSTKAGR